jgi:hypothetical protein
MVSVFSPVSEMTADEYLRGAHGRFHSIAKPDSVQFRLARCWRKLLA